VVGLLSSGEAIGVAVIVVVIALAVILWRSGK
jgi:hypothetical protein